VAVLVVSAALAVPQVLVSQVQPALAALAAQVVSVAVAAAAALAATAALAASEEVAAAVQ
jgi:hypothetical protein